eukprot:TRINITY_DN9593_c0_g1_i5.p1 TRINITY_DN9593_c0_g1~~TRINITY_DN9593_c0_g1_i5.p1  ORF type:complete len:356 (+),score=43.01 TRINITY_DN9593_c0_g1_i5:206-1273(+)
MICKTFSGGSLAEMGEKPTAFSTFLAHTAWKFLGATTNHIDRHEFNLLVRSIGLRLEDRIDPLDIALREQLLPVLSSYISMFNNQFRTPATKNIRLKNLANTVQMRQRWLDAKVQQALADGIQQVVVLYGGYDNRGFIMSKPGVKWIDIDTKQMAQKKQQTYAKLLEGNEEIPDIEFDELDFGENSLMQVLSKHKFDMTRRSLFIMEDVVSNLTPDEAWKLFMQISEATLLGSRIYFDFVHKQYLEDRRSVKLVGKLSYKSGLVPSFSHIRNYFKSIGFYPFEMKAGKDLLFENSKTETLDILPFFKFAGIQRGASHSSHSSPSETPPVSPRESSLGKHATLNLSLLKFGYIDDI